MTSRGGRSFRRSGVEFKNGLAVESTEIRTGTFQPSVIESGRHRVLQFSVDATQSRMRISRPNSLVDAYTRKMMSFLLFVPAPLHVVILGLGGGSLAKFCYANLPGTQITAVEISPAVVALRNEFCVPPDDERFRVVCDDGARYLTVAGVKADVLLIDAFDVDGIALSLLEPSFCREARRCLASNGVIVMNLCGESWRLAEIAKRMNKAFNSRVRLVPVGMSENVLLFAFRSQVAKPLSRELSGRASELRRQLRLNFPRYLRRIEKYSEFAST